MTSQEIRKRFLDFFAKRNHAILDSASLITADDPKATNATLFNTAGMQPLIPFLMGESHSKGSRLASSQKCVRTGDLEEVGDNTHATFFEMLGNWSLGDYFKEDAITWSWQFLTDKEEGLGLDPNRLYVTVFAGNDMVPKDTEAVEIWKQFIPEHRIYYRDSKDNWWTAGANSPAGPSTEMFYDLTGELGDLSAKEFEQADEDQKLVEIWNDVFMAYKLEGGEIVGELPQKNVDTGAGLERVAAVMQGTTNIFDTDLFVPLLDILKQHARNYNERHARIIADHIKTAVFLINDGVVISNTGRGYVLRRILRRAYNSLEAIECSEKIIPELIHAVVLMYKDLYFKDVDEKKIAIKIKIVATEMDKIVKIIQRGVKIFKKLKDDPNTIVTGKFLMDLEQTQGLPLSMSQKLAKKFGIIISDEAIEDCKKIRREHQELSRKGAEKKFKGGLAEDTPKIRALHTATHLMLAGLRKELGDDVHQKGSNITEERTRFDFTYDEKVSRDILDKVEDYVNNAISTNAKMGVQLMDKNEAKNSDVVGSFWEKYPDTVKVWTISDSEGNIYSRELCGGPHVDELLQIAEFGTFKIKKEESSSAGVRRIKAILEK
ncbi:MAG: alanine--tRNA ligase [Candidatus Pacebacteria bacterium]|nr:alanine--tRNA ligase [Candidatus Paceibacterota bacterium]